MGSFRLIEHTADMGIEALGETREELFMQAARGLVAALGAETRGEVREEKAVNLQGEDGAELLVLWLNEILYLLEIQGFFPVAFKVETADEHRLRAAVGGEPFDPERHPLEREVKAVTYHRLSLEHLESGWFARVYVDL